MSDTKVAVETPVCPDRRSFLKRGSIGSAVAVASSFAFGGLLKAASATTTHSETKKRGLSEGDREILIAAEIAEALAVTTYTNIINTAPFFGNLESDDQGYLIAARNEEMSHYLLEQSATGQASPFSTFYYPPNMFSDAQTTLVPLRASLDSRASRKALTRQTTAATSALFAGTTSRKPSKP